MRSISGNIRCSGYLLYNSNSGYNPWINLKCPSCIQTGTSYFIAQKAIITSVSGTAKPFSLRVLRIRPTPSKSYCAYPSKFPECVFIYINWTNLIHHFLSVPSRRQRWRNVLSNSCNKFFSGFFLLRSLRRIYNSVRLFYKPVILFNGNHYTFRCIILYNNER